MALTAKTCRLKDIVFLVRQFQSTNLLFQLVAMGWTVIQTMYQSISNYRQDTDSVHFPFSNLIRTETLQSEYMEHLQRNNTSKVFYV